MNESQTNPSVPDFLVHDSVDSVGVVVVEDINAGNTLTGWVMDTDETIIVQAKDDIPLGHKIALVDLDEGASVIKYGHSIGRTVAAIGKGAHLHVHNTKTEKW
ncbi:MAG: UxaA family hydrolase [Acidiferrobacterales bacterium]|nr:UxaA family hydrolase [Acidiferrobacterales bacterium]